MDLALAPHPLITDRTWGIANMVAHCFKYIHGLHHIFGRGPTPNCCAYIRKADMIFFCESITTRKDLIFSGRKVVAATYTCHNPVPKGTKCGGIYILLPPSDKSIINYFIHPPMTYQIYSHLFSLTLSNLFARLSNLFTYFMKKYLLSLSSNNQLITSIITVKKRKDLSSSQ